MAPKKKKAKTEHPNRTRVADIDPDILLLDGMDDALVGVGERCGQPTVAVYEEQRIIDVLARDMDPDEAAEFYQFNIAGAWVGERTPLILTRF